jgi:hypothetical protein
MSDLPSDPAPFSTRVTPPTSTVTGPARVACIVRLVDEQPEPELSFSARVDPQGVSEVRAAARGASAIVAIARVLIVLFIVAGAVVIVRMVLERGLAHVPRTAARTASL